MVPHIFETISFQVPTWMKSSFNGRHIVKKIGNRCDSWHHLKTVCSIASETFVKQTNRKKHFIKIKNLSIQIAPLNVALFWRLASIELSFIHIFICQHSVLQAGEHTKQKISLFHGDCTPPFILVQIPSSMYIWWVVGSFTLTLMVAYLNIFKKPFGKMCPKLNLLHSCLQKYRSLIRHNCLKKYSRTCLSFLDKNCHEL